MSMPEYICSDEPTLTRVPWIRGEPEPGPDRQWQCASDRGIGYGKTMNDAFQAWQDIAQDASKRWAQYRQDAYEKATK
jgi:hypothetical protein